MKPLKKITILILILLFVGCNLFAPIPLVIPRALEPGETVSIAWSDDDPCEGVIYRFYYCNSTSANKETDKVLIGEVAETYIAFCPYDYLNETGQYLVGVSAYVNELETKVHWSSDDTSLLPKQAVFEMDVNGVIWLFDNINGMRFN